MNEKFKRCTAGTLAGIMMTTVVSTTAFAAETPVKDDVQATVAAVVSSSLNENISVETANKIAQEILNETYDYSGLESQERNALSKGVKTVLKFIKNNWPKVVKILKKYGVKAAESKGVIQFIDDLLDGVIEVSDSIDAAIYAVVDFVAPGLSENTKQIIANAIRLVSPV